MVTITIETKRVENMVSGLNRNLPKAITRGINKFSERLANELRKEAKLRGHVNTGFLSGPRGTFSRKKNMIWEIKMPKYITFLEKGTRPHFIPRKFITELWARKHNMSFGTFRHIVATKGTKPHPFTQFVINKEIRRLKKTVEKEMNKTIRSKGRR